MIDSSAEGRVFLDFSIRKLQQLTDRIEAASARFEPEHMWWRGSESQNAVGNLLLHLSGNVRQWIISSIGGQPDHRVRDEEFAARGDIGKDELLNRLKQTVAEAASVLESLPPERLLERIRVQKYDLTVLEAIYHVVEHFAQHTGQILYFSKLVSGKGFDFYTHLKTSPSTHQEQTP